MTTTPNSGCHPELDVVPDWIYHRQIRPWVPVIQEFIAKAKDYGIDECHQLYYDMGMKVMPLRYHGGYYTCPILSDEACEYIVRFADNMYREFKVNPEEELPYQIPELVLSEHSIDMDNSCKAVARELIWPLFELMYGNRPNHFTSVQLARYQAMEGDIKGTGWHSDESSEATCVVSLSPERHTGGGTALRVAGALKPAIIVGALPRGHALLFNGRTTMHRGLPLASGQRNLLVYWCVNKTGVEKWIN